MWPSKQLINAVSDNFIFVVDNKSGRLWDDYLEYEKTRSINFFIKILVALKAVLISTEVD